MTRWTTSLTKAAVTDLGAAARGLYPQLTTSPVLIGEGISTLTFGLSGTDGDWALRVSRRYPEPWRWRGGRGHEIVLLSELRRRGVPVPDSATVIESADGLPAAILERRIVGRPLSIGVVRDHPGLISTIATVLDRLHRIDVDHGILTTVPRDDPVAEFRQALAAVDLGYGLRQRVETAMATLEGRSGIRTLCHRDFRVEHLIVDEGQLVGLLDLGEVGVDDPAVDLAFLHGELGAPVVNEICAAMETADPDLGTAARTIYSLWPLLELAPGGETWGDPATARGRLEALL